MRITFRLGMAAAMMAASTALPLAAAPLFSATEGSLSADLPVASRTARVTLDKSALMQVQASDDITVAVPGAGNFHFVVARAARNAEVFLIEGALRENKFYRIVLGVRAEGVSGVIATPSGVFSLGYVNNEQWLGMAGSADRYLLAQGDWQPRVFSPRPASRKEQLPVKGAMPVTLNLAQLADMTPGDEALITLPDIGTLRVTYDDTHANADSASWVGHLKDFGKDYRVLLTYSPTGTLGHILTPRGELAIETTANGNTYLVDPRRSGLTRVEGENACAQAAAPEARAPDSAHAAASTATTTSSTPTTAAATTDSSLVDVLVVYPASFVTDKGSVAQAEAAIDHLVALTNQAYRDSGVAMQIRKVGTQQVTLADSVTNNAALDSLTNGSGAFSTVKARRDTLGADLVSLVRPFYNQYHGSCGVAWIGGYNGSPISGASAYGFSVVSDGRDRANSGWYCDVTSFAHELGHNQGLMHDRATVARQGGGQGATPYAYGYGIDGSFGTVMSYIWPKIGKFSNPSDSSCGGTQRCGVPVSDTSRSADNARALNFTRSGVAGFRTATVVNPPPPSAQLSITGLLTVYGIPRANATVSGAPCTMGSNGVYQCKVSTGFTGTLVPSWIKNGLPAYFTPRKRSYTNLTTNMSNQNFSGNW